jgi:endogenous inhibitor of DNA gyrase (YacG/DUF329 family)
MIPISVSDILKVLDQIPLWKTVRELPKRVTELERRISVYEAELKSRPELPKIPEARLCPICGAEMKVKEELAHPQFAFAGLKLHTMECPSCGNKTTRDYQPGKGYQ